MFASYNQLHMYGFSDIVNLLCSAPGTALPLKCWVLCESCKTRVINKTAERLEEPNCSFFFLVQTVFLYVCCFLFNVIGIKRHNTIARFIREKALLAPLTRNDTFWKCHATCKKQPIIIFQKYHHRHFFSQQAWVVCLCGKSECVCITPLEEASSHKD